MFLLLLSMQGAVAELAAKISGLSRKLEGLISRNKAAGEPDDPATSAIHAAAEAISLAENLQRMVDKTPDLLEVLPLISATHRPQCSSRHMCIAHCHSWLLN